MSPLLRENVAPGVVLLRLHRPEVLNALNLTLRQALADAFHAVDQDPGVYAIVIGGSERAFCAGADLQEYVDATPTDILARQMDQLWGAISGCSKPVIAAVRGHALGGGCELAMHADIIVAGQGARFGQPEVKIGIMPGGGATQRLTRAVGKFAAMKILLSGEPFTATEAFAMGLASEVVPDAELGARAQTLCERLARAPTASMAGIKQLCEGAARRNLHEQMALEKSLIEARARSSDASEGVQAFLEKRAPRFSGR